MGTTNLLTGTVGGEAGQGTLVRVGGTAFVVAKQTARPGAELTFSLRPEALQPLAPGQAAPPGWVTLVAQLTRLEFLGALTRIDARIGGEGGTVLRAAALDLPLDRAAPGQEVTFAYDPGRVTVFA
jgi:ABC-type Fe3+/spermidine/putrescine transport system ATPase subunit